MRGSDVRVYHGFVKDIGGKGVATGYARHRRKPDFRLPKATLADDPAVYAPDRAIPKTCACGGNLRFRRKTTRFSSRVWRWRYRDHLPETQMLVAMRQPAQAGALCPSCRPTGAGMVVQKGHGF